MIFISTEKTIIRVLDEDCLAATLTLEAEVGRRPLLLNLAHRYAFPQLLKVLNMTVYSKLVWACVRRMGPCDHGFSGMQSTAFPLLTKPRLTEFNFIGRMDRKAQCGISVGIRSQTESVLCRDSPPIQFWWTATQSHPWGRVTCYDLTKS